MIRLHVERVKTLLFLALAVVMAVVVVHTHRYGSVWIPLVLGALAAFFGWRAQFFAREDDR